jgi:hypothetical protein
MSKAARQQTHRRHHRHGEERPKPAIAPMSDRSVYLGAVIIGLFVIILGGLLSDASYWPHFAVGYLAVLLYQVNAAGWSAYRGKPTSDWKHSLAKLPLRTAGFGTKTGKPIEAAHGQPAVRTALMTFGVVSLVAIAGLAWLVLARFTPSE